MVRHRDQLTVDMFLVPQAPEQHAASMMYAAEVAALVASMFDEADQDRIGIAAEMTRLIGKPVSKYMLDAWTSESRKAYNLPFYLVPAAEAACKSHAMSNWLASKRGARLLVGREALEAEYGKLRSLQNDIRQRMKQMERFMGGAA